MAAADVQNPVPVAEVAVGAYRLVFGRIGLFLDLAALPLIVTLAAALVPGYLRLYLGWTVAPHWSGDAYGLGFDDLVEALTGLVCVNAFAVRWYQNLFFPGDRHKAGIVFFGAWARFLVYTLLLYVVSAGLLTALMLADIVRAPAWLAPAAGGLVALVWIGTVRCSLLFPAAAYGQPQSVGGAWRAMRGNSWRLFGCFVVSCMPTILVVVLVLSTLFAALHLDPGGDPPPLGFFILRGLLGTCANFIVVALGASVLASFYRRVVLRMPRAI